VSPTSENRFHRGRPAEPRPKPVVRRIPVDSVLLGSSMTHRPYLWAAYTPDGMTFVAVGVTASEARRKYYKAQRGGGGVKMLPLSC
jgi:hypothetical protein